LVKEIRGRGLMIGVEVNQPIARDLMKASLERGLVFNAVGDTTLRFLAAAVHQRSRCRLKAMQKLNDAYKAISRMRHFLSINDLSRDEALYLLSKLVG
jgi:acetylornithine/succinyldiaminopimelate/putrescine aminotransferase